MEDIKKYRKYSVVFQLSCNNAIVQGRSEITVSIHRIKLCNVYSPGGRLSSELELDRVSSLMIAAGFLVVVVCYDIEGSSCFCFPFFAGLGSGSVLSQLCLVAVLGFGLNVWGPPL